MSRQLTRPFQDLRGTIRHRLLVNALVDPDEAARRLPDGLRPHVTGDETVIGCCLLTLAHVRPAGLPATLGLPLTAVAHRISVEWTDASGAPVVGVYVPVRHTTSRAAQAVSGRWFPGVHRPAAIESVADAGGLRWTVEPRDDATGHHIRVTASIGPEAPTARCEPVADTCLTASVGLSPDRHGTLEGARMELEHTMARRVEVEELDSGFLAGFSTLRPAASYLMTDVPVRWRRASAPRSTAAHLAAA